MGFSITSFADKLSRGRRSPTPTAKDAGTTRASARLPCRSPATFDGRRRCSSPTAEIARIPPTTQLPCHRQGMEFRSRAFHSTRSLTLPRQRRSVFPRPPGRQPDQEKPMHRTQRATANAWLAFAGVLLLSALPPAALAQPADKTLHVGILSSGVLENRSPLDQAFVQGLRDQGYLEGKNLIIASLANPGQNVTGTSSQAEDLLAKRLELLAPLVPKATTIAVLMNASNPVHALGWQRLESAAREINLNLLKAELTKSDDLPAAIDAAVRARAGALFVMPDDPMMFNLRPQIVELAAKNRMPDFYWASQFVESGGLMSYGENLRGSYRATAAYMDRIKKGANPGDLPVEQPTRFELVINMKTAKALGITVPQSLLMRADDVIQ